MWSRTSALSPSPARGRSSKQSSRRRMCRGRSSSASSASASTPPSWSPTRSSLSHAPAGRFIPSHRPLSLEWGEHKGGLRLYIQRVLIMDKCEALLPPYLRFVAGVVDSLDLPLNVSREILQQNPQLEVIQKNVVKNVLDGLAALKNTEYEKYVKFHQGLAPILKEAFHQDWSNREKVADLLL